MSGHLVDVSLTAVTARGPATNTDFGAALARCALTWHQQPDEGATLAAITADTPTLLPGANAAAVIITSQTGQLEVRAAEGPLPMLLAALPTTWQQHPWNTGDHPHPVADRWPIPATLEHHAALGSIIYAPLGSGPVIYGTLLILSADADVFTPRSTQDATTLAIHAFLAVADAQHHDQLQQAIQSRDIIGQAKGILTSQQKITAEQAFQQLRHTSQTTNIRLHQIAENLCRTGELTTPHTR